MTSGEINTQGLRKFVKHLAIVTARYKDREDAKEGLKKHIQKLKAASLGKKTKKKIMDEFKELESKINEVLDKEASILRMEGVGEAIYKKLIKEVTDNRNKMDRLNNTLFELRERMKGINQKKLVREARIERLEKKIKLSQRRKRTLPQISDKLKLLEKKYNQIKNNPKYSKKELDKIKFKINSLRLKAAASKV